MANFWSWIAQVCAICAATIGRIAVILFLLCLQMHVNGRLKWLLYTVGAATTMINIIEIGLIFRQCEPVASLWDPRIEGNCSFIPITTKVGFFQGSVGALADFTLALYPILIIGPLQQMRMPMKIGLCIIMAGGIVYVVTLALRSQAPALTSVLVLALPLLTRPLPSEPSRRVQISHVRDKCGMRSMEQC